MNHCVHTRQKVISESNMAETVLVNLPQGEELCQQMVENGLSQSARMQALMPAPCLKDPGFAERFATAETRVRATERERSVWKRV